MNVVDLQEKLIRWRKLYQMSPLDVLPLKEEELLVALRDVFYDNAEYRDNIRREDLDPNLMRYLDVRIPSQEEIAEFIFG